MSIDPDAAAAFTNGRYESMTKPAFAWPEGKRIAVAVQVMFEVWSEGKAPSYSVQTTALKPGAVDYSGATWAQYGGRVGVWRIMRTLERFAVPGTFVVNAKCAELFPEAVARIAKGKHEVAAHGITQDQLLAYLTPEEERKTIRQCLDILEKATGKRPEGWISPVLAWTPHTVDFLAQEGALWYGDPNYVDLPILLKTKHGPLVGVPGSEFTDNRVLRSSPRDYFDVYKDTFDYLYRNEPMAMLSMGLHCHWGGRPPVVAILDQLLQYVSQFPDVWFASFGEIARWVKSRGVDEITYRQRYFRE